jgi:hypothetical protein
MVEMLHQNLFYHTVANMEPADSIAEVVFLRGRTPRERAHADADTTSTNVARPAQRASWHAGQSSRATWGDS